MKARSRRPWWWSYRDASQVDGQPLDFVHQEYLRAVGLAAEVDGVLSLDAERLADYRPPPGETDDLALFADAGGGCVRASSHGTRLDPVAAQRLWTIRERLEPDGAVTSSAWCTSCGRRFDDARFARGRVSRIARWCRACENLKSRRLPQLRLCEARDCDRWFVPSRANQVFHSGACRVADARARASMPG